MNKIKKVLAVAAAGAIMLTGGGVAVATVSASQNSGACTEASPYPDVPQDSQFCQDIQWAKDKGITSGYTDGTFRPGANVSRQAMAAFLHRLSEDIPAGAQGPAGPAGPVGATGPQGANGLADAVYRVENYLNGGGGSATVACADDDAVSQTYTAIAGGVQGSTVGTQSADGFAVTSSFPGRMDWNTGEPKANRLDGWIVLGNGKWTGTLKVWALCVPTTDISVQTVDLDN
jgi:hypothetical protein